MKKYLLLFIGASLTLLTISCKKDYACECTVYFSNGASLISKDNVKENSIPKAQSACNAIGEHNSSIQTSPVQSYECILK